MKRPPLLFCLALASLGFTGVCSAEEKPGKGYYYSSFEKEELGPEWDGSRPPPNWSLQGGKLAMGGGGAYRGRQGLIIGKDQEADEVNSKTQVQFRAQINAPDEAPDMTTGVLMFSAMMRVTGGEAAEEREFMDFDGALLSMVKVPEREEVELYLFHSVDEQTGWWFSTGAKFPICTHKRTAWLEITVRRDYTRGSYDVAVDGQPIMNGIGAYPAHEAGYARIWFFGGSAFHALDDVYVGPNMPVEEREKVRDELFPITGDQQDADVPAGGAAVDLVKQFSRESNLAERRRRYAAGDAPPKPAVSRASPEAISFQLLVDGKVLGQKTSSFANDDEVPPIIVSAHHFVEAKRITVRFTLRANIAPGMRLDYMTWTISQSGAKEGAGGEKTQYTGHFGDGLVQEVDIPRDFVIGHALTMSVTNHGGR